MPHLKFQVFLKHIVKSVRLMDMDGNIHEFNNEEMEFDYRKSILSRENYIVLSAVIELEKYSADKKARTEAALSDGEIILGGGHMTVPQLEALLNTLPIEITFVDDNNINRFFNEGPKVFKRPQMAIDREVFSCHPPKIEAMVRAILDDFRNNKRDRVPVWMEKNGKPFLVTYMAVRDKKGNYLGTVEVVQDMQFAKEHFEQ